MSRLFWRVESTASRRQRTSVKPSAHRSKQSERAAGTARCGAIRLRTRTAGEICGATRAAKHGTRVRIFAGWGEGRSAPVEGIHAYPRFGARKGCSSRGGPAGARRTEAVATGWDFAGRSKSCEEQQQALFQEPVLGDRPRQLFGRTHLAGHFLTWWRERKSVMAALCWT